MIEMAYGLMVEAERVNRQNLGVEYIDAEYGEAIRHLAKVKNNFYCLINK